MYSHSTLTPLSLYWTTACDRSHPFKFWDYGCEVSIRYVCEEVAGNADCGLSDTVMEEESFQTADVEACRSDFHR